MVKDIDLNKFSDKKYISRIKLIDEIKKQTNYKKDSSIRWVIYDLVKQGKLTKIDADYFYNGQIKDYHPVTVSNIKNDIEKTIKEKYPHIDIIIYESSIMNEWLNHQISRNIIFVEVEKYFMQHIFNTLKESTPYNVLYDPSINDFYLYVSQDTIIVTNLITRTPMNKDSYDIKIEKLIVDMFSNHLISEFYSQSEYDDVLENIFSKYKVNIKKVMSYAKRRHIDDIVYRYIDRYDPRKEN